MSKNQSELDKRIKSFHYAIEGCYYVLKTQKNARIHAAITSGVIILGVWLMIPRQDWAMLILTIALVWMAEFLNTSIEAIVDMTMPDPHPLAKIAKDVSAGAVLLSAVAAIIVGLIILGPPLWAYFSARL